MQSIISTGVALLCVSIIAINSESNVKGPERQVLRRLDGTHVNAVMVAFSRHQEIGDLTELQKRVDSYWIDLREAGDSIVVKFTPKLPPGWKTYGGETSYGREAEYVLEKETLLILKQTFFR